MKASTGLRIATVFYALASLFAVNPWTKVGFCSVSMACCFLAWNELKDGN